MGKKKNAFGMGPELPVPPELLGTVGGLFAGHGTGKSLAGQTAASLAAKGKKLRTEEKARRAAIFGGPIAGLAALALAKKYGLSQRVAARLAKKFPGGLVASPELERQAVEIGTPFVAGMAGTAAGGLGTGALAGALSHLGKTAGMDFLDQNRPEKVKEIYSALKRDHPDMPAEMKARIASRRGKKNAMSRKSPKDGGPKYKAPITTKYKGAGALPYALAGAGAGGVFGAGLGAASSEEGHRFKGGLLGAGIGAPIGAGLGALGYAKALRQARRSAQPAPYVPSTRVSMRPRLDEEKIQEAVKAIEVAPSEARGDMAHKVVKDILMGKHGSVDFLQKRAADLRNDIVNRAMVCGEAMEKTAAEQYFHNIRKPDQDVEMLGAKFCKLAHGIGRDPWELALEVADHFPAYAMLSKTAADPKARELAEFYLDWSDEMEKTAFVGAIGRGIGRAAAKVTRGVRKMRGQVGENLTAAPTGKATSSIGKGFRESMGRARGTQVQAGTQGTAKVTRNQARRQAAQQETAKRQAATQPAKPVQQAAQANPKAQAQLKQQIQQKRQAAGKPAAPPAPANTQVAAPPKQWGARDAAIGSAAVGGVGLAGVGAHKLLSGGQQRPQVYR